jgi:hypothetical protein
MALTEDTPPESNQPLDNTKINPKLNDSFVSYDISVQDKEVLMSLLHEYEDKLMLLCQNVSDIQEKNMLRKSLTVLLLSGLPLLIIIFQDFIFQYLNRPFRILLVIIIFVLLAINTAKNALKEKKLKLLKNEARRIATRLERVVRLGYQVQENMFLYQEKSTYKLNYDLHPTWFSAVLKIELDLRLTDAESALEYYKEICH